jgi:hypothetical protein
MCYTNHTCAHAEACDSLCCFLEWALGRKVSTDVIGGSGSIKRCGENVAGERQRRGKEETQENKVEAYDKQQKGNCRRQKASTLRRSMSRMLKP